MSPSKESGALAVHFKKIVSNFPQDGNHFLERALYEQVHVVATEAPGVTIEDIEVPADGVNVPCKWLKPEGTSSAKHVILFMHGGGFSFGSAAGHRKLAAHLALASSCPLLSVDYRLSPENKYPAALNDCLSSYQYLLSQGYAANRIAVAGDSCGGGLSASVPLAALKRGLPVPGASIALSPWYDLSTQKGGTMESNSENDLINTAPFVEMLSDRYVSGSGHSKSDPLISPLLASNEDTSRLPPTWISVGGYDMLRDHGERMGEKLSTTGVEVVVKVQEGQQHVMEFMVGNAPEATESVESIAKWVRRKVGG